FRREQRAVRNVVTVATPDERAAFVAGTMNVNRVAGDGDGILEFATAEHVLLRHHVMANDAARLADAEERRGLVEIGFLETGHVTFEISEDVVNLPARFDFA